MASLPRPSPLAYLEALLAVAAVAWLTAALLPVLGLASAALLFMLPVLLAAARGGIGPGIVAALGGAAAYNFFLLEPRYSFQIHQLDNLISVVVLVAVAIVTSRLATRLMAREAESRVRARASEEAAALATELGSGPPTQALEGGLALLRRHYGEIRIVTADQLATPDAGLSALDLSAAAWAMHNGDLTGHGTETMAAADWTFVPLAPRVQPEGAVAALARPLDGTTRTAVELEHIAQLGLLLGQCRDRAALEQERHERERLEERDRLRRTLLSSLAHDFRTPLTVITGQLELLARAQPDAGEALAAARRLDRTMADLLSAARIEAGSLAPRIETVDLVDVVGAACGSTPLPPGRRLDRAIPANLPFVAADPVLLQQIVVNLLDNALRHAHEQVTIGARSEGKGVTLTVDDDGPGIPEADRTAAFERFTRLDGSDRTQGSGLGLAIVKGFAEAMGMTVAITDAPGGGARCELTLPMAGAPQP
ncbi:MAG TPA: ATP-binding protein [Novosphingobium sp.]